MFWFLMSCVSLQAWGAAGDDVLISDSVLIDVTPTGLEFGAEMAESFLPESLDIPGFGTGCSDDCGWLGCLEEDYFGVFDATVFMSVSSVMVSTSDDGRLSVLADLYVSLNDPAAPFLLEYDAYCFAGQCDAWVDPFPVYVLAELEFIEVPTDEGPVVSPQIVDFFVEYYVDDSDLNIDDCSLDTLRDIADLLGISVTDLALGAVDAQLEDLTEQIGSINESLVGVLDALNLEESIEVTDGVVLDVSVLLEDVMIDSGGIRLHLAGGTQLEKPDACILPYDDGTYRETPSDPPEVGEAPVVFDPEHILGIHTADEFVNQLLYTVWQSGLLCQTLDEDLLGDSLPLELDTQFLPIFLGNAFDPLFPEPQPILMQTHPARAPYMDMSDGSVGIRVEELGLSVITAVDARDVRLTQTDLSTSIGFDISFDEVSGALGLGLDLSGGVEANVTHNPYVPDENASVEEALEGLLDQPLIAGLVEGLAGDLTMGLPPLLLGDIYYGVNDLEVLAEGEEEDWLGLFAWIGPVPYTKAQGCSGSEGCGDSKGCSDSEGCDTTEGCDVNSLLDKKGCDGGQAKKPGDCAGCSEADACEDGGDCDDGCSVSRGFQGRTFGVLFALCIAFLRRREPNVSG